MTLSRSSRAVLIASIATIAALVAVVTHPRSGSAQEGADAATVAGAVQAFYNQTKGVQTSFYQTYFNKLYDRYDRSRGTVTFAKPGKMRWDYARPNGKIIASDGSALTVYTP
ncbi:MAG: outer membrane lipoprotein carrier protein LolA, partial [Gammaproteobacteria bacterium]|nr:outer membrane lipoprotein carrier protein LolA [Gammaproteobacteria bacterium]NIR85987.1 outer membrane lipoprotein carrier protein LolA [Gammaproteobacteria bacterium]NIU07228.1 outer membrane lipoprotein carrier protein LolA [Gammaproteobacteria bacterium]NIV54031.1 outer membrane lipoprotein carrier protein LolA [Gammaproteobacteria bacterium]NIX88501.1 outer membrane lipoprotein carrier protein LolA [Gammaproteobacteria bacterium]